MYISSKMPKLLIFILLFTFKLSVVSSEIINEIRVEGNNRVSEKTVINFSDIKTYSIWAIQYTSERKKRVC